MSESGRFPFTPHELSDLLDKLDEVMAEAVKLREEVSRQLADQNRVQLQRMPSLRAASRGDTRPRPRR